MSKSHDITLLFDSFAVDFSLGPIGDWWESLRARNARLREQEALEGYDFTAPEYKIVEDCPHCGASVLYLSAYETEEGRKRFCVKCQHSFPVC